MGLFSRIKKHVNNRFGRDIDRDYDDYNDYDDYDDSDSLSVYDAALYWASNGKDEDYTFGFSVEELEDAL